MQTLSNGYKLPETGDLGNLWFEALEDNITLTNDHSHNGIDSNFIQSTSIQSSSASVLAASFVNIGGGYYRATVTVPNGGLVDNHGVVVKDATTKEQIFMKSEKASSIQVYIYTNFVLDVEVLFT